MVDPAGLAALAFAATPTPTLVFAVTHQDGVAGLGHILGCSESFLQLLGLSRSEVVGQHLGAFLHPDDDSVIAEGVGRLLDPSHRAQVRIVRPGWGVVWVALAATIVEEPDGSGVVVLTMDDITGYRRAEQALAHRASHDPLTGLPNRAVLLSHLERVLARLGRRPGTVAVMFVDLDGFKNINDTYGHRVGDQVLKEVARRISVAVRRDDVVTRMGGDEFVVVCDALESSSESAMVAERIRDALDDPFEASGRNHQVSASIGVAQTSDSTTAGEDLLRRADLAMYLAKDRGRNRVEFFAADLEDRMRDRVRMVEVARTALITDQVRMSVQPVFDLAAQNLAGYEALARIRTPDGETLSPQHFLEATEQSGLITRLDSRILQRGIAWLAGKPGPTDAWLACNVSVRTLTNVRFPQQLLQLVVESGVQPGNLVIEISEAYLLGAAGPAFTTLRRLRNSGFRVALDDFGTGLSSLTAMRDLPLDIVKIDGSFVAGLGTDQADESIVSAVISVAHDLGQIVIAEGVERPLQAEFLRAHGCDLAQGYLFGPPAAVTP